MFEHHVFAKFLVAAVAAQLASEGITQEIPYARTASHNLTFDWTQLLDYWPFSWLSRITPNLLRSRSSHLPAFTRTEGNNAGGEDAPAIINGQVVQSRAAFAYLARIETYKFLKTGICTGSLVHVRYVLTAGHCLLKNRGQGGRYSYPKLVVILGDLSASSLEGTEQRIKGKAVAHPDYPSQTLANDPYDIGLIRLKSAATINANVQIIPMAPAGFTDPAGGTVVGIAGWGLSQVGGSSASDRLRSGTSKVASPFLPCAVDSTKQYCLQSDDSTGPNTNPCKGDSGGPVTLSNQLIGVISVTYSTDCNTNALWGAVKVAPFYDWIQSQMT